MSKKLKKTAKRKRYFGVTKVSWKDKLCWVSKQSKNGWSLGLALNNRTIWLTNVHFSSEKDIKSVVKGKAQIVFVHLKNAIAK